MIPVSVLLITSGLQSICKFSEKDNIYLFLFSMFYKYKK